MSDLVSALAGGAIGSAITMLARVAKAPAEVGHHDRQIRDIDQDLERFVADEHTRLAVEAAELQGRRGDATVLALDTAYAVNAAIHKYRDEETRRIREVREVAASEGAAHWTLRVLWRRPFPSLTTPARAASLVDRWPRMVVKLPDGRRIRMTDPRQRSIDHIFANATLGEGDEGDSWDAL